MYYGIDFVFDLSKLVYFGIEKSDDDLHYCFRFIFNDNIEVFSDDYRYDKCIEIRNDIVNAIKTKGKVI